MNALKALRRTPSFFGLPVGLSVAPPAALWVYPLGGIPSGSGRPR